MFTKKLKELKENKQIAAFYTNIDDTSKFSVGYVLDYNEDYFLLAEISPKGLNDGFVVNEINNIIRINVDSRYENKIKVLAEYQKTIHENIEFQTDDIVFEVLKFAKIKNYIVSIELINSGFYDIQGYVATIEKDNCLINQVTEYGDVDGMAVIKLSDITKISCNSNDEVTLKILNCSNDI